MRRVIQLGAVTTIVTCLVVVGWAVLTPPTVLLVGDSITGQYGPVAASTLRHHGYHVVVRDYPGLGVLDQGPRFNVPQRLRADLRRASPRVVVAEFSGNYGIGNPPRPDAPEGSAAFFVAWAQAADQFTRDVKARGSKMIWLLSPPPVRGDRTINDGLAAVYKQVASQRHVSILDPGPAVSAYEVSGDLHAPDGRHLSLAGISLVSDLVAHRIESVPAWRMRLEAVPQAPLVIAGVIVAVVALVVTRPRRTSRRRAPAYVAR